MSAIETAAAAIMAAMGGKLSRADALRCATVALAIKPVGSLTSLAPMGFPDYGYTADFQVVRTTRAQGTKIGRIVRPFIDSNGYSVWNLRRAGGGQGPLRRSVVVCTHYHGPRPDGLLALHGDGNPQRDTEDNLRWGTMAENMADMVRHGRAGRTRGMRHGSKTKPHRVPRGEAHPRAKLTANQVRSIRASQQSGPDLSRLHGVSVCRVNQIKRGEGWQL